MIDSAWEERPRACSGASSMPTVSVVMPVHDEASYLAEALDSLFAQTCQDFEVICIDDGSTDGTASVLAATSSETAAWWCVISRPLALSRP
jgi:cellulose synthase/poly-beta-1,6-N-acetylglucosamine synthase-like glycosyltransferase